MATYTVRAPDGKTVTLNGPDGASEADVIAQAQKLYQPKATAAPAPPQVDVAARSRQFGKFSNATNTQAQSALALAESNFQNSMKQKGVSGPALDAALARFRSDPRYKALAARAQGQDAPSLTAAGRARLQGQPAPPPTRAQLAAKAGAELADESGGSDFGKAILGGIRGVTFGGADRLAAAAERYLPSAITGNYSNASYDDILNTIRARSEAERGKSLGGNILGSIIGGAGVSRAIGGIAAPIAARAATAASPVIARGGNILQSLMTLNKGATVANGAKLAATGGAFGAANAAGEGKDAIEGGLEGAAGSILLGGAFKLGQVLTRPLRDVLRLSGAGQILSRLTTATRESLETRAQAYRDATGADPTLFEILPLADRNKILKQAVTGRDNVVEAASAGIRARANNLGPEMSARARAILTPNRDRIVNSMTNDLAAARGGQNLPGDAEFAARAAENPVDMSAFRDAEARAIMAPHDDTRVVDNLNDLFPSTPGPRGQRIATDPEVNSMITSVAGSLRRRADNAGITAGDITNMMSDLRSDVGKGGIDGRNAQRAIDHLQDVLGENAPEAAAAAERMNAAYAARSRMMEGMQEGAATRLRGDVQVGTSRSQARKIANAYDTAEGGAGRVLGQGNRVISSLGGSPEDALRATIGMSRGGTGRELGQNVGGPQADALIAASRAQDESAQALAAASSKAQSGGGESANAETLVSALAGLHPSSFITTKAGALRKLIDMTYIPEGRARTIVDMIFSQDPAMTQRALNAIGNEKNGAQFFRYLSGIVGAASANSGAPDTGVDPNETTIPAAPVAPSEESNEPLPDDESVETGEGDGQPVDPSNSPYAEKLQEIYDTENPDLLDLVDRVSGQESRGNQFDNSGQPITSSAGAVGIMQVMPQTGPEAAKLAGVPWDPQAYRFDAAYNKLIGIAYLSELLRKYDGDVAKALAAYNAGPGRVDRELSSGGDWISRLPAETQDYVQKIG